MKLIILLSVLLFLFTIGCGGGSLRQTTAGQIMSASWEGENILDEDNVWKPLNPPVIISTADSGNIVALFVGECASSPKLYIDPETSKPIEPYGKSVELRIKVNDIVASPSTSIITMTPYYETRSFLASQRDLPPGTYTITAEWRSIVSGAYMRNRTLTVWETIKVPAP